MRDLLNAFKNKDGGSRRRRKSIPVLAAVLLLTLLAAGCTGDVLSTDGSPAAAADLEEKALTEAAAQDTEAAAAEPVIELDAEGFPVYDEEEETALTEDEGFVLRSGSDAGYANAFFGFRFDLPEGWTETAADAGSVPEDPAGYLKDGGIYRAFAASNEHGYNNTFVVLERMRTIHTEMMTPEALLQKAEEYLAESMAGAGADLEAAKAGMEEFLGEERPVIRIQAKLEDVDVYETQVIIMKGTYVANILAVSYGRDDTAAILEGYAAQ